MFGKHASETRRLTSGQVTQGGSVVATEVGGRKVLCSKSALSEGRHVHFTVKSAAAFFPVATTEHVLSTALSQQQAEQAPSCGTFI